MITTVLGWIGIFLIFSAYWASTANKLKSDSWTYLFMNILGSLLFGIDLLCKGAFSGVALQTIWIVISCLAIVKKLIKPTAK